MFQSSPSFPSSRKSAGQGQRGGDGDCRGGRRLTRIGQEPFAARSGSDPSSLRLVRDTSWPEGGWCSVVVCRRMLIGGPLAATQPIEKLFSKPDFEGPPGSFPPGHPFIEEGALRPTSIDEFPRGKRPFHPPHTHQVSRKTSAWVGRQPEALLVYAWTFEHRFVSLAC